MEKDDMAMSFNNYIEKSQFLRDAFWKEWFRLQDHFPDVPEFHNQLVPILGTAVSLICMDYISSFPKSMQTEIKEMLIKTLDMNQETE